MKLSCVFGLLTCVGGTAAFAEGDIGSPMETCEKGAIVKDKMGATGRVISDMAGMCLVTFPNGTANVNPGGSNMHPPASLTRQAALNVVAQSVAIIGEYQCTNPSDMFQFYFELAADGTYTLQESAGTYENSDRNSIKFIDGELDGASGWMNQGTMGLRVANSNDELRCVLQQ
jgi:hypothetical protein